MFVKWKEISDMAEVKFKSIKKKRPIRKRDSSSDEKSVSKDIEEPDINEKLSETLELQKLRKRPHGVNAITLASGKKVSKVDELVHNDPDPFKIKTGGLLTLDKGIYNLIIINDPTQNAFNWVCAAFIMAIDTYFSSHSKVTDWGRRW